ncbi:hypothetical protein ID144_16345 [Pseudomonas sp. JM0905a]|uniref:Uncharacterized protein n=1 Tax=Metapseudomonas resinovorans TaxID=53412 RepID=A0ABT4Y4R8_METRE|nr:MULTISPECIES: hypothetical protein [Pseudomonas]MBD2838615.1 hypothetical protein [Pseudomonas sp. JM0905a]MDA8483848.1 hypothetical protein [Pseudomonas resinovorans]
MEHSVLIVEDDELLELLQDQVPDLLFTNNSLPGLTRDMLRCRIEKLRLVMDRRH